MKDDLNNRIIFMTGATSGLGKVSALKAANQGAKILALARNKRKGVELIEELKNLYPNAKGTIEIIEGNLDSFESVIHACHKISAKYPVIDLIVNNAGLMNFEPIITIDGIEETLQVNLLSPLLIFHLLYANLKSSTIGKIIFTSSGLHQGEINFDNLEFKNNFSSFKVYRQSKLGVILVSRFLADRLKEKNISIYSQHPGMVRTELGRSAGWFSKAIFFLMGTSPEKGSETLSFLIETPNSALKSGEYYADKQIKKTPPQSYDMRVAEKLMFEIQKYLNPLIQGKSPFFEENQPEKHFTNESQKI